MSDYDDVSKQGGRYRNEKEFGFTECQNEKINAAISS